MIETIDSDTVKPAHSPRRRAARRVLTALAVVGALLAAVAVTVVVGHTYDLDERRVAIPGPAGELDGVLALPPGTTRPVGLVVFVHGDGPVDATSDGFYRPLWEAFARAGYASLSWSKPGVGASDGNWLDQSMHDRALEVGAALDWARRQDVIDPERIGLWGASQAGWVLPEVAATRDDVRFVIAVAPAINWLRQGRFNLLAELDHDGASTDERARAVAASDTTRRLLRAGATHAEYLAAHRGPEPMSAARWGFVSRNYTADATADLVALGVRDIPVLLVLGDEDRHVDVDETEATYRALLGDRVTVACFAGAAHSLARSWVEDDALRGIVTAVLAPRQVFVPGFLDVQRAFLAALP
ncbi:alpha/beta hydrolase family protein [Archangium violaceum]|uniref:alpha/beta hydrolase family protein n=1 Tax=Archangium violaceum TaxID=83451 RepID=UPI0037BE4385